MVYYEKSKPINEKEENWLSGAKYNYLVGLVYHIQSKYTEAIKYYTKSLDFYKSLSDNNNLINCYSNIGVAFYNLGNYEKALENYFISLKISEETKDSIHIAGLYSNIGAVCMEQEKLEDALDYYTKANYIATQIDSKSNIADTYRNIGEIYIEERKFDSVEIVYNKAFDIYKELNDMRGEVIILNKFGRNYYQQTEYTDSESKKRELFKKSLDFYNKSLTLNNEVNEKEEKINSYLGIGEVYLEKKQYQKAIRYLNKAEKMAEEIESLVYIKSIQENLSKANAGIGDFKKAYYSHVLFKNLYDSLKNDENIEVLTQTRMQYEFDKQQKEQEFIQAQKDLEYKQKQKRERLIRIFILIGLVIVSAFSIQMMRSYQRKKRDNELLEEQKEEIEKQKQEITDSIIYAKRIQTAILPTPSWVNTNLPEHFILFRPRDIVSGDYYWMNKIDNKIIVAAADCTGHGVPGAFMSMLGVSFLNEIVNKNNIVQPNIILNQLRSQVKHTLDQTGKEGEAKDGMDIALCVMDIENMVLQYAGAYNPLYLFRNGELLETKADRMPIGIYIREKESFTNNEIKLEKGDTFYIFSDGYADQFGGEKGGKFKTKAFKQLLADIQSKSMEEQHEILNKTIDEWRGDIEQIDDIIVLGIRV
jgi:serine phosphatase RsbU (regulator of sigma subunit)